MRVTDRPRRATQLPMVEGRAHPVWAAVKLVVTVTRGVILGGCMVSLPLQLMTQPPSDERNPRVGKWRLNVTKSTFYDAPVPNRALRKCEAVRANSINVKIVQVYLQGNENRSGYPT